MKARIERIRKRILLAGRRLRPVTLPVLVIACALIFVLPWAPTGRSSELQRYMPLADGDAYRVHVHDRQGRITSAESQNIAVIAPLQAFNSADPQIVETLTALYGSPEGMHKARMLENRRTTLEASGEVRQSTDTYVLDERGLLLVATGDQHSATQTALTPPALTLPADLEPGRRWSSVGKLATGSYRMEGRVSEGGSFKGASGTFNDCLIVRTSFTAHPQGTERVHNSFTDHYCSGVGLVKSIARDERGEIMSAATVVASETIRPESPPHTPPPDISEEESLRLSGKWELSHIGRLRTSGEATPATIAPLYVPTEDPFVLAVAQEGDLTAFGMEGEVRWRFHPEGSIYSPPAFDDRTGRIYFGSTDKRLYALDSSGLFLWSHRTDDNVTSRPVISGNTVIFGGEDGHIYGLDADTGRRHWRVTTSAPVASSPALARGVVVVGADDGSLRGMDPGSGDMLWEKHARGAIEAPVSAREDMVYAARHSGEVVALNATDGRELWSSSPVGAIRTAPTVTEGGVHVVDTAGTLTALDRRTGKTLWTIPEGSFVGPPLAIDGKILVAGSDGAVSLIGETGEVLRKWDARSVGNPVDGDPLFAIGPTAGGDGAWLASDKAALIKLGPPPGYEVLKPTWAKPFSLPPFKGSYVQTTPLPYEGAALLLDSSGGIYLMDPQTGDPRKIGAIRKDNAFTTSEPTISGHTLLSTSDGDLLATRLPSAKPLWRHEAGGTALHPAQVADGKILWSTSHQKNNSSTLYALSFKNGEPLWERSLPGSGGSILREGVAYTSPGAAFELETGEKLWESDFEGQPAGMPALSPEGDILFFATTRARTGEIYAVNAATGEQLWHRSFEGEALGVSERLWVSDGALIVPALSGAVIALDPQSGKQLWRHVPSAPRLGGITVEGGRVWMSLNNGEALSLEAATGEIIARSNDYSLNLGAYTTPARPAIIEDNLMVSAGSYSLGFEVRREDQ